MRDREDRVRVTILGGGASGLVASIAAARAGACVTLLEANERVGKKLLRTGDGRCNLTNVAVAPGAYNDPDFVEPILSDYTYERIRMFFEELGLLVYEDERGRVFPYSNTAASVLDVLRLECEHLGVRTLCAHEVCDLSVDKTVASSDADASDGTTANDASSETDGRFCLRTQVGEEFHSDALVLATGDDAGLLGLVGHHREKQRKVLCPLRCEKDAVKGLEGLRVQAAVTLLQDGLLAGYECGEVIFKKDGISGIPILDLSRVAEAGDELSIDLFPGMDEDRLVHLLKMRCKHLGWRSPKTFLTGMLHSRLASAVFAAARRFCESSEAVPKKTQSHPGSTCLGGISAEVLAHTMKDYRIAIVGMGDKNSAQLTRGGARLSEFDPATLESRIVRSLYATGELLDVDGRCGGFNLHWAWASGLVAGMHAASSS